MSKSDEELKTVYTARSQPVASMVRKKPLYISLCMACVLQSQKW